MCRSDSFRKFRLTFLAPRRTLLRMTPKVMANHRRKLGLTQVQLAAKMLCDPATISRKERGVLPITADDEMVILLLLSINRNS